MTTSFATVRGTRDMTRSVLRAIMSTRRAHSASPSPRVSKRPRLNHLTPENFKNGIFLAPMVRSGACKLSKILNVCL